HVAPESLGAVLGPLVNAERLASAIAGVKELPVYHQLCNESTALRNSLQVLHAYCSAHSELARISNSCGQMLSQANPQKEYVNGLVAGFESLKKLIDQIEPGKKSRLYETISARVKEVHQQLEALINKV
ncbi:MAG: hypothetical protein QXT19_04655, partial [Candidatus Woesearchaeota archaeon]